MQEANAASGPVTIAFAIAGTGVHTIQLGSQLPAIANHKYGITVDGYTQPGSRPNTDGVTDNGVRTIEIVGNGPTGFQGFVINSPDNAFRGLDLHGFRRAFEMGEVSSDRNTIVGDIIGLTPSGAFDPHHQLVNGSSCVEMAGGAHQNVVGAPGNATREHDRRLLAPRHRHLQLSNERQHDSEQHHRARPHRYAAPRRLRYAIDINTGTEHTLVGGTGTEERNVLSGNDGNGIEISHEKSTMFNDIIGNYIGTNLTATAVSGVTQNNAAGVHLEGKGNCGGQPCPPDENHNLVADNVIAGNAGPGC